MYGFLLVCVLKHFFKFLFYENAFEHLLQKYGFWPWCILNWFFKFPSSEKYFWHWLQGHEFLLMCVLKHFFIILILLESLYTLNASIWILACVYSQMIFKSSSYEKAFWHWWHWNRDAFLPNCIFFATNTLCLLESNINTLCLHLLARLLKLSTSYSNVNNGTNAT